MSPAAAAEPDGDQQDRHVSKLIFCFFVFGAVLLCVGVLLSIFGFQACQYKPLPDCPMVLKVAGPACAVVGLGAVILARSRAQLQLGAGLQRGQQMDPDRAFICGESRQFAQCLIFGFLFLTSGMLISVLGIWVPGCGSKWAQEPLNETDTGDSEPRMCGFLSLQIMGPLIVLVGLCFFVVAHVKKRNTLNAGQDASEREEGQIQIMEPVQVTVGGLLLFAFCFYHSGFAAGFHQLLLVLVWILFLNSSISHTCVCTRTHPHHVYIHNGAAVGSPVGTLYTSFPPQQLFPTLQSIGILSSDLD
nr:putative G-protein coupled receptor [Homo sapiens]